MRPPPARAHDFLNSSASQEAISDVFGSALIKATVERKQMMRGFLIGVLVVAVGVLGYLYYQDQQDSVSIELEAPSVTTN
jgi:hypothetical protein